MYIKFWAVAAVAPAGVLTDIFDEKGRQIIDGLIEAQSRKTILSALSLNVQRKLDRLEEALSRAMSSTDQVLLRVLVNEHDALQDHIASFRDTLACGL